MIAREVKIGLVSIAVLIVMSVACLLAVFFVPLEMGMRWHRRHQRNHVKNNEAPHE